MLQVDFDTHLDLAPYMSNRRAGPQMYELFGVLVHAGHSVHSGHYFCFVRAPNGLWHRMDDVQVSQVCASSLYFPLDMPAMSYNLAANKGCSLLGAPLLVTIEMLGSMLLSFALAIQRDADITAVPSHV